MDITLDVVKMANVKRFFNFMNERHAIYMRRKAGDAWPWTADPILQAYSFTNCYRQLDRGTVWLTENIIKPYEYDNPLLFFNILVYRCHNRISTAKQLGWITDYSAESAQHVEHTIQMLADSGVPIFTAAFMVTGSVRENGVCPKSKVHQMFGITFPYAWNHIEDIIPVPGDTLEVAFNRLALKVPGIGRFVAYEIITDLRHTFYLENATDINTWANPGPGARRGLGRILGLPANKLMIHNTDDCIELMRVLLFLSPQYLADWMPTLELRDIEMSLCEYSKYMRISFGGKARRKFVPPNERSD